MTRRYTWRDGKFVDKATGEPMLSDAERNSTTIAMPYIRSDLPGYMSPVTGKWIEGRSARREDLARTGCREVDPTEYKPLYQNYEFCQKHRKPYMGGDVPPPMSKDEKMYAREKKAKLTKAEKAADRVRAEKAKANTDPDLAKFARGNPYSETTTLSPTLKASKR
jgi:hypothetical protein